MCNRTGCEHDEGVIGSRSKLKEAVLHDKVLVGAMAGVLAAAVRELTELGFYVLGILGRRCTQLAASMFVTPATAESGGLALVIGFLADATISGTAGVLFVYFICLTGRRLTVLKGLLLGPFYWVSVFGALKSWHLCKLSVDQPLQVLLFFLTHLIWGLTIGWFVNKYGRKALAGIP